MRIERRDLFKAAGAGTLATMLPGAAARATKSAPAPARLFKVTTTVDLAQPMRELWLPLFQSAEYQRQMGAQWESDGRVTLRRDPVYGAPMLHIAWDSDAPSRRITLNQRVATWERTGATLPSVTSAERDFWTQGNASLPTDGIVRETAQQIIGSLTDPKAKARAIFDWVIANGSRDPKTPGCGPGDIKKMLESGNLGGKCADLNSLFVGLARASGLPARDVYGIRLGTSWLYKSLGKSGDITGAQHCRAEVFLDGEGWFAVDPADVLKAVLEEGLPKDSSAIRKLSDRLFGQWESNWAGYNSADNIVLPDAANTPRYHFLMYPSAMSPDGLLDCLDAKNFVYSIKSEELTA